MAFPTDPIYKLIKEPVKNEIIGVMRYENNSCLLYTSPSPRDRG